jgi:nicotinate-nucleotide pyrophosphorylase (carboxylating)
MIQFEDLDYDEFIKNALLEDLGDGDHTSMACIPSSATGKAKLIIKQKGILAGITLSEKIFSIVDPTLKTDFFLSDGNKVNYGDVAFIVEGSARSILKAERLVLNCMQRMSGIATFTHEVVEKLKGTKTKVLDTRKTTPGIRLMEKWAVKIGGGTNHRIGLYDMILIKDNHIDYAGGIKQALMAVTAYKKEHSNLANLPVEIETRNLEEVKEVLQYGCVDRIMLDNFSFEDLKKAISVIDNKFVTEASGGITQENIVEYAQCGVNFVSMGALTHSVKSLDMSLKAF